MSPLDLYDIGASLSDEERMVRDSVARLVDERILPVIQKHFEEHTFPHDLVPEIASLGLLGSSISGYGCAGMNSVSYGLICQELERGDSGIRSFVSVQSSLCMYPIHAFGSEAQREKYLPRMATGELIGCFGLTEPQGGSDPGNMKTHAKRRGKDWVLNGAKMWITNAPIADFAIVWAKTEEGIRGFIVEKGMRGYAAPEIERKFSLRASATGALFLEDVVVPEENMLPGSTVGLKAPLSCLTQARFGITWGVIGAAQACLAQVLDYTKTRDPVRQAARREPGDPDPACGHGPRHHRRAAHVAAARAAQGRRATCTPRRSRSPSGTTAAWRSTSPATRATCWGAPASAPNTSRSGTPSTSKA